MNKIVFLIAGSLLISSCYSQKITVDNNENTFFPPVLVCNNEISILNSDSLVINVRKNETKIYYKNDSIDIDSSICDLFKDQINQENSVLFKMNFIRKDKALKLEEYVLYVFKNKEQVHYEHSKNTFDSKIRGQIYNVLDNSHLLNKEPDDANETINIPYFLLKKEPILNNLMN